MTTVRSSQLSQHINRLGNSHSRPLWTALTMSVHKYDAVRTSAHQQRHKPAPPMYGKYCASNCQVRYSTWQFLLL